MYISKLPEIEQNTINQQNDHKNKIYGRIKIKVDHAKLERCIFSIVNYNTRHSILNVGDHVQI